jgi:hypothetical protein
MEVVQRRMTASLDARNATDGKTAGKKDFAHGPLMRFQFMNNVITTLLIEIYYFWQRNQLLTPPLCPISLLEQTTVLNERTNERTKHRHSSLLSDV